MVKEVLVKRDKVVNRRKECSKDLMVFNNNDEEKIPCGDAETRKQN